MAYQSIKFDPLTEEEIKERAKESKEEMQEVLEWEKEEQKKLKNSKTPQAQGAAKRALEKGCKEN